MSLVLDKIREKYPQYKDIEDDVLAEKIGSNYPAYLEKDADFKTEFNNAVRKSLGDPGYPVPRDGLELAAQNFQRRQQLAGGRTPAPEGIGIEEPIDVGGTIFRQSIGDLMPSVKTPEEAGLPEKIAAGIYNPIASVANFALSPSGIATALAPEVMGAKIAGPILKGTFLGLLSKALGEKAGEASVTKDPQDITEAAMTGGLLGLTGIARNPLAEKGEPNASTIRSDTGQLLKTGQEPVGSETIGRNDLESQQSEQPEPVDAGKVVSQPAELQKAVTPKLSFEEFSKQYQNAFNQSMKYSPDEAGSGVWIEKMAALSDAYPEWAKQLEEAAQPPAVSAQAATEQSLSPETVSAVEAKPPVVAPAGAPSALPETTPEAETEQTGVSAPEQKQWIAVATSSHRQVKRLHDNATVEGGGLPVSLGSQTRSWKLEDTPENRAIAKRFNLPIRAKETRFYNELEQRYKTPPAEQPVAAVAKVDAQVQQVARTEGQRPAKEIKTELVQRLEKAIEDAPNTADVEAKTAVKASGELYESRPDTRTKISVNIPGDGDFTIWNTKEALGAVLDRAKKLSTKATEPVKISRSGISSEDKQWIEEQQSADAERQKQATPLPSSGDVQMTIVPGAKEFIEKDVIPALEKTGQTLKESGQQVKALLSPPSMGEGARLASGIVREHAAELAQKDKQAREQFAKAKREMDYLTPAQSLAFIDRMEKGQVQPSSAWNTLQTALRTAFDQRVAQVRALGTGKLDHVIQDYFPHIWKDPDAAVSWYARILGKRPLRGPASFLKRRSIPLTSDGVAAGLEPVTWNPIELSLLKLHEIDRYVMGQKIFTEFKDKGLAEFSRSDIPPAGKARINDRIANVIQYRPTTTAAGSPGAPERILRGHWYVQEDAARILNNFLSPGLERFKWFRALRWVGNTMNMAQLGLSGYHFTFTMIDSGTSKLSLGLEQVAQGKAKSVATMARGLGGTVLANQIEYFYKGSKVLQEYTKPGSVGGDYAKVVDGLLAGGGRVEMPKIFKNSSLENFFTAIRSGNYPGAVMRAPFAAIEAVSYPLMQVIVPRLKLGAFAEMAMHDIDRLGPTATREEFRDAMGKIWDSVDNRMGELVYDNLFWNRTLKDLSFLGVRAVGWNLGTVRELGGGVLDSATLIKRLRQGDPVVTKRMAYLMALPMTVGMMGALYQYAHTGKGPEELRDYFYPKTGKMLPDGTPERVNFPSYLKDIASYGRHPLTTIGHKLHPLWATIMDMVQNKDYYGTQIRNPDDPLIKQLGEDAAFVGKQFVPFSVKGLQRRVGAEQPETKGESFFGVMPIPPEIARTTAQNKIMEYGLRKMAQGPRTQEEQMRHELRQDIENQIQSPSDYAKARQKLVELQRSGEFTRSQRLYEQSKLRFERLQMAHGRTKSEAQWLWRYKHLDVTEAQSVYDSATPAEQKLFARDLALKKRHHH